MSDDRPVRVLCRKADGVTLAEFKTYPRDQVGQARIDAAALCRFGIPAHVEDDAHNAPAATCPAAS